MEQVVQVALNLLSRLLPQLSTANASLIAQILEALAVLVPLIIKQYKAMKPPLLRIITALKNSGQLTEDQWNELSNYEVQIDADFDESATKAIVEDEAADKQQS